jgi:hypothetical protein
MISTKLLLENYLETRENLGEILYWVGLLVAQKCTIIEVRSISHCVKGFVLISAFVETLSYSQIWN